MPASSGSVSFGPSSHGLDVRLRWDKRRQGSLASSRGLDVRLRWDKRHQGLLALAPHLMTGCALAMGQTPRAALFG